MPRGPRDDAPGVAHHVMARGIARGAIFVDDADRREFVRRLELLLPALGFRCFAFALIPNHFHLIVQSGATTVSRLMARLGTGYARYFNQRHDRVGHVFQNRFASRRVVGDGDLMGLVRYVCLNPLEAGLVSGLGRLEEFPWCSAGSLLGRRPAYAFELVSETLALFDDADLGRARVRLRTWLAEGADGRSEPAGAPALAPLPHTPVNGGAPAADGIAALLRDACLRLGVSEAELRSAGRSARVAAARASLVRRAATELGLSGSEMARLFGFTPSGVSRMLARADAVAQRVKRVKERPRSG